MRGPPLRCCWGWCGPPLALEPRLLPTMLDILLPCLPCPVYLRLTHDFSGADDSDDGGGTDDAGGGGTDDAGEVCVTCYHPPQTTSGVHHLQLGC